MLSRLWFSLTLAFILHGMVIALFVLEERITVQSDVGPAILTPGLRLFSKAPAVGLFLNFALWTAACWLCLTGGERLNLGGPPLRYSVATAIVVAIVACILMLFAIAFRDTVSFRAFQAIPERATRNQVRSILGRPSTRSVERDTYSGKRGLIEIDYDKTGLVKKKILYDTPW